MKNVLNLTQIFLYTFLANNSVNLFKSRENSTQSKMEKDLSKVKGIRQMAVHSLKYGLHSRAPISPVITEE